MIKLRNEKWVDIIWMKNETGRDNSVETLWAEEWL